MRIAAVAVLFAVTASAQKLPSLRRAMRTPTPFRMAALSEKELAPDPTKLAARAGVHRVVPDQAALQGSWEAGEGGRRVWRMALESPDAHGLRFHFTSFAVGEGRVWLHDGSGRDAEIMGPYTGAGPNGDGEFWSDFVLSERVILEYEAAAGTGDALPFRIAEISHMLPGVVEPAAGPEPKSAAASCHLDISCQPEWAETAKSVGHIVYEEGNSTYVCSGTLLATRNRGGTPYFLTADHCVNNEAAARSVQAFWFYQTTRCNGPAANRRDAQRTLGSTYLTGSGLARGDWSLLRLNSVPSTVTFSNWSTDEAALGSELVGIHHPAGDYKRFSRGARIRTGRQLPGANPAFYYTVSYSEGLIEGGSSGSGLFNAQGQLVGVLSSGPKTDTQAEACAINPFPANYGRFVDMFPALRDFLDPAGGGGGTPAPPASGSVGGVLTSGVSRDFTLGPVSSPTLFNGESAYRITVPEGTTRLEIRITSQGAEPQLGFWVRYNEAPAVSGGRVIADFASPGTSGFETLTINNSATTPIRPGTYYIALGLFTPNQTVRGSISAAVTFTQQPTGNSLISGQARRFSIGPFASNTLVNGQNGFTISVPDGARLLEVELLLDNPALDLDLYVRRGQDVVLSSGNPVSDYSSRNEDGRERISINQASQPPLVGGTYFIALGVFARNATITGAIRATITGGGGTTPPGGTNSLILTSGVPRAFSFNAVTGATLLTGSVFQITVAEGTGRLDFRLATATRDVDVDLHVRYGSAPALAEGRIVSDWRSTGDTGDENISISPNGTPPLRPGTYYVALAVFTAGVAFNGNLTATVIPQAGGGGTSPPATGTGTLLQSGRAASFNIPAVANPILLGGRSGFRIDVPQGATRLEIKLQTERQDVDVDLFARFGTEAVIASGKVQADHSSTGPAGSETIEITSTSSPPLRAGTYFINVGVFTTGADIAGSLTATVSSGGSTQPPPTGVQVLSSGVPRVFNVQPVERAALLGAPNTFAIDVPAGAVRLEIRLATETAGVDLDLFANRGSAPAVVDGRVTAEYRSDGATGNEIISITGSSSPALAEGRYFISLAMFSTGVSATGSVTATVVTGDSGGGGRPAGRQDISPNNPGKFNLPAVETPTLFYGDYGFRVNVPAGVSRMTIQLAPNTPSVDLDLYARYESDVELADGNVVADYSAETDRGNEILAIGQDSDPPLRPGTYYIGIGLFTKGTPVSGTVSVAFDRTVPSGPSLTGTLLRSGVPATFAVGPVASNALFAGGLGYRVEVPNQPGRLEVSISTVVSEHDVDLYVRYGTPPAVNDAGQVVSDFSSRGDFGDERVVIRETRAGVYFIGLGVFTRNVAIRGTITATFIPEQGTSSAPLVAPLYAGEQTATEIEAKDEPARSSQFELGPKNAIEPANAELNPAARLRKWRGQARELSEVATPEPASLPRPSRRP